MKKLLILFSMFGILAGINGYAVSDETTPVEEAQPGLEMQAADEMPVPMPEEGLPEGIMPPEPEMPNHDMHEMHEMLPPPIFEEESVVKKAKAVIKSTAEDGTLSGEINIKDVGVGLMLEGTVQGVPSGKHGFHIHAEGSCADQGNAAGGHFNPNSVQHGLWPLNGVEMSHPGDMGNVTIDENGSGTISIFMPELSLTQGALNVAGKAIILHENKDDFGQPTGNAGGRIGCGIIEVVE